MHGRKPCQSGTFLACFYVVVAVSLERSEPQSAREPHLYTWKEVFYDKHSLAAVWRRAF